MKFTDKRKAHLITERGQTLSEESFLGFLTLPQEKEDTGFSKSPKRHIKVAKHMEVRFCCNWRTKKEKKDLALIVI